MLLLFSEWHTVLLDAVAGWFGFVHAGVVHDSKVLCSGIDCIVK